MASWQRRRSWVVGVILGLVFAVLSYLFWYIAVVILFASIGYWLGWGFMSLIRFSETGFVAVAIGLLLGAVFAVAAFVTGVPLAALVVITAVAGARPDRGNPGLDRDNPRRGAGQWRRQADHRGKPWLVAPGPRAGSHVDHFPAENDRGVRARAAGGSHLTSDRSRPMTGARPPGRAPRRRFGETEPVRIGLISSRPMPSDRIVVRGAREHNLRNIDVEMPRDQLIVITGLSGSGKSSLAFDTIYAEGQRRYVESLSAYARQFLGQMEKPDVDQIDGLSPAISIDQKGASKNPRSTVGTVTEIYDYLRLLFARIGRMHCPVCGREIERQTVEQIVDQLYALPEGTRVLILAPVVQDRKGEHEKVWPAPGRLGSPGSASMVRSGTSTRRSRSTRSFAIGSRWSWTGSSSGMADAKKPRRTPGCLPAGGLHRDRAAPGGRDGSRQPAGRRDGRDRSALLRALRLPGAWWFVRGTSAEELLVQLPARGLPGLHRAREPARDRP